MGTLFNEMRAESGNKSKLDSLESIMEPEDYQDLLNAIADETVSAGAISRILNKRGIQLSQSTITAHRRSTK